MPDEAQTEANETANIPEQPKPGDEYNVVEEEEITVQDVLTEREESKADDSDTEEVEDTETEDAETTEKVEFDDDLLARAREAGLGDDIENFSPESLEIVLDAFDEMVARTTSGESGDADEAKEQDGFDVDLDPDLYDEAIIKAFKAQSRQVAELREAIGALVAGEKVRAEVTRKSHFEALVAGLDKATQNKLFSDDKSGRANRAKLWDEVEVLRAGYQSKGRKMPSESELVNRALRSEFPDELEAISSERLKRKVAKRQSQFTSKPTARDGQMDDLSPTQRAQLAAARMMADKGMGPIENDEDLMATFL